MNVDVTEFLENYGAREFGMAVEILSVLAGGGLPGGFEQDEIRIMFNKNSGFVFLTNSEFQVAMVRDKNLEMFYSCPECGFEGFENDLWDRGKKCCKEHILSFDE